MTNSDCIISGYAVKESGHAMATLPGPPYAKKVLHHRLVYCTHHKLTLSSIAGKEVRHTCDIPNCINPAHLVLGTHADNMHDMVIRGRSARGEQHYSNKLTAQAVLDIRASTKCIQELAGLHKVTPQTIGNILNRITWKHI